MPGSRESSVLRTLAVAFGDGLAFGVGLTLTKNAARIAATNTPHPQPEIAPLADATLTAIDSRFTEIGGQIGRHLSELEDKIKRDLETLDARLDARLDAQDRSLSQAVEARIEALRGDVDGEIRLLRSQMVELHKEFAETLGRLVDEQIERTIQSRLQSLQEQLREAFREETAAKDRQIEEFRARLDNQDRNVLELVLALGQSCLQAAERISPPAPTPASPPAPPSGANGSSSGSLIALEGASDLPAFARPQARKPFWRIPMVSSFLFATTGLLALHYLVA